MNSTNPLRTARLASIDIARGVIMIFMALDHVRIYFSAAQFNAVDPEKTNLVLFLIRWVTHFCAPGFFLIAGMAIFLYLQRCGDRREVARFLVTRGFWLVALELTVIGFAWSFNPGWSWLGVIWSLGWSFLAMAGLIYLPSAVLLWGSAAVILLHAIPGDVYFDSLQGPPGTFAALLYAGGPINIPLLGSKAVLYSILPWLAMMSFGFGLGTVFLLPGDQRRSALLKIGLGMIALFILLRLTNVYGNPQEIFPGRWSGQFALGDEFARTIINFLNTAKYPPSPQFALMTLGPLILLLALLSSYDGNKTSRIWLSPAGLVGRVPMFYYIAHLYLIHGAALVLALATGDATANLLWDGTYPRLRPHDGYGYGSATVLLLWMASTAVLFYFCRWFEAYKGTHDHWWLRYL